MLREGGEASAVICLKRQDSLIGIKRYWVHEIALKIMVRSYLLHLTV